MARTKKTEPKKTATTTALVPWEERLAKRAARVAMVEKPTSSSTPTISLQGGVMSVDGTPVPGNEMDVVVLVALRANEYYTEAYTPGRVVVPACYSFEVLGSEDPEADMEPHEEAEDPQSDKCATCPMNEWGSADTGRGKACKNQRRLAVITADSLESAEAVANAEIRLLKVSPTNIKNWNAYVNSKLTPAGLPEFGVVTRVKLTGAYDLSFSAVGLIDFKEDPARTAALLDKAEEAEALITKPWPKQEELDARMEEAAPKARGRGKVASKSRGAKASPAAKFARTRR